MRKPFFSLLLSSVLAAGALSSVSAAGLDVAVDGVRNDRGDVWIMLYQGPEGFAAQNLDAADVLVKLPARQGTLAVSLRDLIPGDYAAAVLHDENGNGQLDAESDVPTEGYGFTRDAGRNAMPTFEQASIRLPDSARTRIELIYLKP